MIARPDPASLVADLMTMVAKALTSRPMLVVGSLLGLLVLAAGCGSEAEEATESGSTESGSSAAYGSAVLESSVLDGEATTVEGETFQLGSLADTDVVVWFWAPW